MKVSIANKPQFNKHGSTFSYKICRCLQIENFSKPVFKNLKEIAEETSNAAKSNIIKFNVPITTDCQIVMISTGFPPIFFDSSEFH